MKRYDFIKKYAGKEPLPASKQLNDWESWYEGKVDHFHSYRLFNGTNYMEISKRSLGMAKTASEDWANLLANENTNIVVPTEEDQELLDSILERNNFKPMLNDAVEKTFALGSGYLLLGLENVKYNIETHEIEKAESTKITVDFIDALHCKILTIERKRITECAFISENSNGSQVAIHVKDDEGNYVIHVGSFNDKEDLIDYYFINTHSPQAWFVALRPNINNNSFNSNDLGCSIFANAIDVLKTIDDIYDAFSVEYVLARMKIFVTEDLWDWQIKTDASGKNISQKNFDPYDTLFYRIKKDASINGEDKPFIEVSAPQIRYDAFVNGLNTALNLLSTKCGFGNERYKYDKGSIMTATQVISENSDLARSLRKQENLMRVELKDLILGIKAINNSLDGEKFSDFSKGDINILFDDSIIEDKNSIMTRDMQLVNAGLMTPVEFREKHLGLNEEEAQEDYIKKFLFANINKYLTSLQAGAITPEIFVEQVFGTLEGRQELVDYITKSMEKASYNPMELWDEENEENNEAE